MQLSEMHTPENREEFERRMHLFHASMHNGKYHINTGISEAYVECLIKLRSMPNGRLDLLSVDKSARLQINMMTMMDDLPL